MRGARALVLSQPSAREVALVDRLAIHDAPSVLEVVAALVPRVA